MARVDALESLGEKLDTRVHSLEARTPSLEKQHDTEKRVRTLEAFRWQVLAVTGGLAFLGSLLGPLFKAWAAGH